MIGRGASVPTTHQGESIPCQGYSMVQFGQIVRLTCPDGSCVEVIFSRTLTRANAREVIIAAGKRAQA